MDYYEKILVANKSFSIWRNAVRGLVFKLMGMLGFYNKKCTKVSIQ